MWKSLVSLLNVARGMGFDAEVSYQLLGGCEAQPVVAHDLDRGADVQAGELCRQLPGGRGRGRLSGVLRAMIDGHLRGPVR